MDDCRRFRKEPIAQKGLPASSQNATQSTWLIISFLEQNAQGDCCKFGHIRHRELKPPVPHLVVGDHLYRVGNALEQKETLHRPSSDTIHQESHPQQKYA